MAPQPLSAPTWPRTFSAASPNRSRLRCSSSTRVRRFPGEHATPLALGAVLAAFEPAAVDFGLDDRLEQRRLADVVLFRPPGARFAREYIEGLRRRRVDFDRPANGR